MLKRILLSAALLAMGIAAASAQTVTGNEFQTGQAGKAVVGTVQMCINGGSIAVPCSSSTSSAPSGAGSIATGQVTVGTTATQIVPARAGRVSVKVTDTGTTDLYCGAAAVTTTTGDLLAGAKGAAVTIPTSGAVYCAVATGTQVVSFMEAF